MRTETLCSRGIGVTARTSALAVAVGLLAAAVLIIGSFAIHGASATTVRFDGVQVNTTYLNGSASIFGPSNQNGCNQTFPIGPEWPAPSSNCPTQLVGGASYDISFLETGNPGSWPGVWVNLTISAPFNFTVNPGYAASNPTTFSGATGLYEGGGDQLFDGGSWWAWDISFTVPESFASPSGGLWLHATVTVQPTNQTTGR